MESTIIAVRRVQIVADTLDIGPMLARFPEMHGDHIDAVSATAVTTSEAAITVRYDNDVRLTCSFRFTATYDPEVSYSAFRGGWRQIDRSTAEVGDPLMRIPGRAVREFITAMGIALLGNPMAEMEREG